MAAQGLFSCFQAEAHHHLHVFQSAAASRLNVQSILLMAIKYSCVIAAKHFLNGPHANVYRSISKGLVLKVLYIGIHRQTDYM